MQPWICVDVDDIEWMHNHDRVVCGVPCGELVCRRCRATGGLYLHSWLLRARGSRYELCGYGGVMHGLYCGQFLRRGCLGAGRVQL